MEKHLPAMEPRFFLLESVLESFLLNESLPCPELMPVACWNLFVTVSINNCLEAHSALSCSSVDLVVDTMLVDAEAGGVWTKDGLGMLVELNALYSLMN